MKDTLVAKIYARSVLELADEKKVDIGSDLIRLTEVINSSNQLENVLFMDVFTLEEKRNVFLQVASKMNLSPLTIQTVEFLINEKRISLLPLLIKEVIVLDDEKKGFLKGTIEGREKEIDGDVQQKIENYIKNKLGKKLSLKYIQTDKITAGYKVTVDDLQLDASLDNQLEKLKQSIVTE
jgi:F-type H+-transporting ATPase subunit delta